MHDDAHKENNYWIQHRYELLKAVFSLLVVQCLAISGVRGNLTDIKIIFMAYIIGSERIFRDHIN